MKRFFFSLVALALTMAFVLPTVGCSKQEFVANASDVIDYVKEARTQIQNQVEAGTLDASKFQGTLDKLGTATTIASDLKDAFARGDQAGALPILDNLINAVEALRNEDAALFSDPARRALFLAAIGGANVALHVIANRVHRTVASATILQLRVGKILRQQSPELGQALESVEAFDAEPAWGNQYVNSR